MYDAILIPTDGSEASIAAAEHAIDHAKRYDAALHVLYVVDLPATAETATPDVLASLEETGQRAIDAVIERAEADGVETIEGVVGEGKPHRAILEYVDDAEVDLVVMGTHGRTGLDRYLLGSVTEKVVRMADVPVLTVSNGE